MTDSNAFQIEATDSPIFLAGEIYEIREIYNYDGFIIQFHYYLILFTTSPELGISELFKVGTLAFKEGMKHNF